MKINVLGTEYEIIYDATEKEYPTLAEADGYIDVTTKKIYISEMVPNNLTWEDLDHYKRSVVRHEVAHAFMQESGLAQNSEWGRDETLIDWIALQFPKMAEVFEQLEVMK